jgi:hypothetical protein
MTVVLDNRVLVADFVGSDLMTVIVKFFLGYGEIYPTVVSSVIQAALEGSTSSIVYRIQSN